MSCVRDGDIFGTEISPGQVELLGEASIRLFRAEAIFERGFHQVVSVRGNLPGGGASIRLFRAWRDLFKEILSGFQPVRTGYS